MPHGKRARRPHALPWERRGTFLNFDVGGNTYHGSRRTRATPWRADDEFPRRLGGPLPSTALQPPIWRLYIGDDHSLSILYGNRMISFPSPRPGRVGPVGVENTYHIRRLL